MKRPVYRRPELQTLIARALNNKYDKNPINVKVNNNI
jgi:hypothetical protein